MIDEVETPEATLTNYKKLKKKFITEWFDMFTKNYDLCDSGGYVEAGVSASGKKETPTKDDWDWKWYDHELLWR